MSEEFDWNKTEDAIVVKPRRAVAVYTNPAGDLVIRQERMEYVDQDDPFVVVPIECVDAGDSPHAAHTSRVAWSANSIIAAGGFAPRRDGIQSRETPGIT